MIESEILKTLAAIALLFLGALVGAVLKFGFDRWGQRIGWSREERKADAAKIERVDSHARSEIQRLEKDLGGRIGAVEGDMRVLAERVDALPTSDDFQALDRRLAEVSREVSSASAKVDGVSATAKTILQHILAGERRA